MAERSVVQQAGLGAFVRRISALLTEPPACAICGRGHASTGWLVDPSGRINGRCPDCLGDAPYQAKGPDASPRQPPL